MLMITSPPPPAVLVVFPVDPVLMLITGGEGGGGGGGGWLPPHPRLGSETATSSRSAAKARSMGQGDRLGTDCICRTSLSVDTSLV
jgi:hypothetical protein